MKKVKKVEFLTLKNGKCHVEEWLSILDSTTRARIVLRLSRLEYGNYGDYKKVSKNIFELRFFFGSGYRIYFLEQGKEIILLLNGGDKQTQSKDIIKAQELLQMYGER